MAKTVPTKKSVASFIAAIPEADRRRDCKALATIMKAATGAPAKMWGPSIVGFGTHRYAYASGHSGETCMIGFSPRKAALTVYLMAGLQKNTALLARLGKHKTGGGCLYIKNLDEVDRGVLQQVIKNTVRDLQRSQA